MNQDNTHAFPTAEQIVQHLDEFVIRQKRCKLALARTVVRHFYGLASRIDGGADFGRQALLIIGPSGSGKTYLVQLLAAFLRVPFVRIDCSKLVGPGYVGDLVDGIFRDLDSRFGSQFGGAIAFLDELDKKKVQSCGGRDIAGKDVQAGLLSMLDGDTATFKAGNDNRGTIDTRKVFFVAGGAFHGLADIVRHRTDGNTRFGFGATDSNELTLTDGEALAIAQPQDIIEFGFIPELINRFTITSTHELSPADLVRILRARDSALTKQNAYFAAHGVRLNFTSQALREIANTAHRSGKGARGLQEQITKVTADVEFHLPSLTAKGLHEVRVTPAVITGRRKPICKFRPHSNACLETHRLSTLAAQLIRHSDKPNMETVPDQINRIKKDLAWHDTTGAPRRWWEAFEKDNSHRLSLVLRTCQELQERNATITEFFLAYVDSKTDNIQANLHYLDYMRLVKKEHRNHSPRTEPKSKRNTTPNDNADEKNTAQQPRRPAKEAEFTLVRCPGCLSLVPAHAGRCTMCGETVDDEVCPPQPT